MLENGVKNLERLRNDIFALSHTPRTACVDRDFIECLRHQNAMYVDFKMPVLEDRADIVPYEYEHDFTNVVLFSDGILSLATALKLRELRKDVVLYHIEEDQKTDSRTLEIANLLRLPLVMCTDTDIQNDGYSGMMMLNRAMTYAVSNGYSPKIYGGFFPTASVENNMKKDWKYCKEYIDTYAKVASKYIKDADVLSIVPNYSIAEDELLRYTDFKRFFQ